MYSFVKRGSAADNLLLFLVSGVVSVVLTRLYLHFFDYPQIARGDLHIAHALFGGILLTVSTLLPLCFHGRRVRQLSAMVGGFGLGWFVDEIGKFITRENNYFFQPVPALIYFSFILIFMLYRHFNKYQPYHGKELAYEVLEQLESIAEQKLYDKTKRALQRILAKFTTNDETIYQQFAAGVSTTVERLEHLTKPRPNKYVHRLRSSWQWLDDFTAERKPVFYLLLFIFLIYTANLLLSTWAFLQAFLQRQLFLQNYPLDSRWDTVLFSSQLVAQTISALLMIQGFTWLVGRRRKMALESFKTALAVDILVTHLLGFYFEQFSAAFSLVITFVLFALVHNILEEEKR